MASDRLPRRPRSHLSFPSSTLPPLLLLVLLAACAAPQPHVRVAPHAVQREAGPTPQQLAWIEENCPAGMPQRESGVPHGPTQLVAREGYALEHSCVDRIPLWVCEHVTLAELQGSAKRRDKFAPDHELEESCRAELADYRRSGYDRGHLAPAGNHRASKRLKDETFYLSNMSPQVGNSFNRHIWRELEEMTRDWVADRNVESAYIITGGFFYDPAEEDPATADGLIEYHTVGGNSVAVPTHFYKIVAAEEDGAWKAVAFVLENRRYSSSASADFTAFIKPIDWVEHHAGLDFLPDLSPVDEPVVEGSSGQLFE